MMKVGQICTDEKDIYVITNIWTSVIDNEKLFCSIDTNGITDVYCSARYAEGNDKLIAEYPTWQEAVNSNEFKGE